MIDSHHHLWRYDPVEYAWIGPGMERLQRSFLPADLEATVRPCGIDGVVSVQARQSIEETRWLLELAAGAPIMKAVVGWVPLIDPGVQPILERFAANPRLRAVRHVLQDEPDDAYMLRDDFNRGVALLKKLNLVYDILIFERHLPQTLQFIDRHSEQVFVLDHIAKPRIRSGEIEPWRTHIRELARRPNVYCKLSGMVTEADWKLWTPEQLQPYVEPVLEAFGPARLMFGSDWPVCLAACDYARWVNVVRTFTSQLSPTEQSQFWHDAATKAYGLK